MATRKKTTKKKLSSFPDVPPFREIPDDIARTRAEMFPAPGGPQVPAVPAVVTKAELMTKMDTQREKIHDIWRQHQAAAEELDEMVRLHNNTEE